MSNQDQFSGNSESLFVENLPQKKEKIETECEETDRISKLPYAIIVQILSFLSIAYAFRTTVLPKDWQYFWTCINNTVYDNEEYGRLDSSTLHKFISLMDNVLPLLSCSSIKNLSLNFVFRYGDGVFYFTVVDKWLEFFVNKKVEDLRYTS
uniref:F-box family protein n=1 Tax=Solanum tuberosum TaxID=4113 RepID=M1DX76_SOLTU